MRRKGGVVQQASKSRVIAVFAHNEAKKILACLESVKKNIAVGDQCVVLNNGSTDTTHALVTAFAQRHDFCRLIDIEIGDKSNAWNVFIHQIRMQADVFCFLDGDCEMLPDSLNALEACMVRFPSANAIAAIPADHTGHLFREAMLLEGGLAGNLYALPSRFVERIRATNTHLPVGLIGDDCLVGALAYWDLEPKNNWDPTRIVTCAGARFSYTPLSFLSLHDIRLYYRRKIRYSLRRIQTNLMKKPLKQQGLRGIPQDVDALYCRFADDLRLTWRGTETWFDWLAIKEIKTRIALRASAPS